MFDTNFPERISELIFDSQKSIQQISDEIGCNNATIYHYVSGRYLPTLEMTIKLADYFNCTTDYLLGLTAESQTENFKPCPPFGARLTEVLKEKDTTRYALRDKTHIAESVMRYWVRGKTSPSIVNVIKIAKALDVSVDYMLGREN